MSAKSLPAIDKHPGLFSHALTGSFAGRKGARLAISPCVAFNFRIISPLLPWSILLAHQLAMSLLHAPIEMSGPEFEFTPSAVGSSSSSMPCQRTMMCSGCVRSTSLIVPGEGAVLSTNIGPKLETLVSLFRLIVFTIKKNSCPVSRGG